MNWKKLTRHPLSAEYADLEGQRRESLLADIREHGFDARYPIVLHDGQILDGWQRQTVCVELDIEPTYADLPDGLAPEQLVARANDNRRHETELARAKRIMERRERVAKARSGGQSFRVIAENEGVSLGTVQNDVEETGATVLGNTVDGRDGKKRPAKNSKQLCPACQHRQDVGKPLIEKCEECESLRKKKDKPEKEPKPGKPRYDEKRFTAAYGSLVREIDARGNLMGKGAFHGQLLAAMDNVLDLYKKWVVS